jgi:hypothetical protein
VQRQLDGRRASHLQVGTERLGRISKYVGASVEDPLITRSGVCGYL